jgi:Uma2 family endonuclease
MSSVKTGRMTADEFWEFANRPENEGKRLELVRGEVVEMPSPGELHGLLCGWIAHLLWVYVLKRRSGGVSSNDTGLLVEEGPDTVRGPDLILFGESRTLDQLSPRYSTRIPQLVVEVLSPNDRGNRHARRVGQYLRRGVPLVWAVDPEDRTVAVYRPHENHQVLDETEELTGNGVLADFRLRVAELFALPAEEQPQTTP